MKVAVLGAGAWGTALAKMLAEKKEDVHLWFFDKVAMMEAGRTGVNPYLAKVKLPTNLKLVDDIKIAVEEADFVLFVSPAQNMRAVLKQAKKYLKPGVIIINCAKGIETKSFGLLSEVIKEILPEHYNNAVFLSGPSFADEVGRQKETAVVIAGSSRSAKKAQALMACNYFRPYTSRDIIGVQTSGAYKNILAISAGILAGMDKGENLQATLLARGLREMARFAKVLGGKQETFMGLSGVGDLVLTARSDKSRNFRYGKLIGKGLSPAEALKNIGAVVEGYYTVKAVHDKAKQLGINLTIANEVYNILYKDRKPAESIHYIMMRDLKHE